ncbi:MAG: cox cluster protein [Haloferacaceae archaeon]
MEENPGLSEQYRMASPWPLFVALGIPISELGVLFGVFPVTVAGLLLFGGSVSGMLRESGYTETPWRALDVIAGILLVVGAAFTFTSIDLVTRGQAIMVAAAVLLAGGLVGEFVLQGRDPYEV